MFKNEIKKCKPENCACKLCERKVIWTKMRTNVLVLACEWIVWVSWFLCSCGWFKKQSINS